MEAKVKVAVPGRVWEDYLDPHCSAMQAELGLPEPRRVSAGKGWRAVYGELPTEQALDLAGYLRDRGDTLLGQGVSDPYDPTEKAERDMHRAAIKAAETITAAAKRADAMRRAIEAPVVR